MWVLIILFFINFNNSLEAAEKRVFKDVPPNHWAYDAVEELYKKGIIEGFDTRDGKYFRGKKCMTRYEFAVALSKALRKIEAEMHAERARTNIEEMKRIVNTSNLTAEDKEKLIKLINEFKTELEEVNERLIKLESIQSVRSEEEKEKSDNKALYLSIGATILSIAAILIAIF